MRNGGCTASFVQSSASTVLGYICRRSCHIHFTLLDILYNPPFGRKQSGSVRQLRPNNIRSKSFCPMADCTRQKYKNYRSLGRKNEKNQQEKCNLLTIKEIKLFFKKCNFVAQRIEKFCIFAAENQNDKRAYI